MQVMQRYLQPGTLEDAGVEHFDTWAANFGTTVTALDPADQCGQGRRTQRRRAGGWPPEPTQVTPPRRPGSGRLPLTAWPGRDATGTWPRRWSTSPWREQTP